MGAAGEADERFLHDVFRRVSIVHEHAGQPHQRAGFSLEQIEHHTLMLGRDAVVHPLSVVEPRHEVEHGNGHR